MSSNAEHSPLSSLSPLHRTVLVALAAASVAVGAFIAIPLPFSPVPIVLQNFFILLMALVLGPRMGTASVALYLLIGALGLPVFAGGKGGFAHFYGPTGGYLVSFLLSAWITGVISAVGGRQQAGERNQQHQQQGLQHAEEPDQTRGQQRVQETQRQSDKQEDESSGRDLVRELDGSHRKPRTRIRLQDVAAVIAGILTVYLLGVPWLAYKLGFDWRKAFLLGCLPFLPGDLLKALVAAALAPRVRRLLRAEFVTDAG